MDPKKPVVRPVVRQLSPIEYVCIKYAEHGWTVINPPAGGINDILAQKGPKLHFVQVVTSANIDQQRYHGEAKNAFIQNAFSNMAQPIFGHVVSSRNGASVTFGDVNLGTRVIIGAKKTEPTAKLVPKSMAKPMAKK